MKPLLIYWVIGCFVIGLPIGGYLNNCPKDKVNTFEMVGMVAIWPAVFAMVFARIGKPALPKTECEVS